MKILLQNSIKLFTIMVLLLTFSCKQEEEGCTDVTACNYNSVAEEDDGSCNYSSCHSAFVGSLDYSTTSCGFPMKVKFVAEYRANGAENTYTIDFGDGTSSGSKRLTDVRGELTAEHIYESSGTYEVSVKVTSRRGGNVITDYAKKTINLSKPSFSHTVQSTTCEGTEVDFKNTSTSGLAMQYSWDFGDGNNSVKENPTHRYLEAGSYTVKFAVLCDDGQVINFIEKQIEVVSTKLIADFSSTISKYSCTATTAQFTNKSNFDASYIWDFGDGITSTVESPSHEYTKAGTYTVTLKTFCKDTSSIQKQVTISAFEYEAGFSSLTTSVSCDGTSVRFTNNAKSTTDSKYTWNFGDGNTSTITSPLHVFASPGTYTVTLKVLCGDDIEKASIQKQVVVKQEDLVASFTNVVANTNCLGTTMKFTNTSSYEANYQWDFGDGTISTAKNPNHIYANSGTYTVALKISCSDDNSSTVQKQIQVAPVSYTALFSHTITSTTCSGSTIKFTNTSVSTSDVIYTWEFGDGQTSTSNSPTHTYAKPGQYEVTLKMFCGSTQMDVYKTTVQVTTLQLEANFQYSFANNNEHAPALMTLENISQNASSYEWYVDDQLVSTKEVFDYEFNQGGTYTVKLVASCGSKESTVSKNIIILSEYSNMRIKTIEVVLPSYLVPDNQHDDTYGLDPYVSIHYNNNEIGYSLISSDVTKYPIFFDFPNDTYAGSFTVKNVDFFSKSTITVYVLDDDFDINEEIFVPSFSTDFILDERYPSSIKLSDGGKIVTMYVEYY